MKYSLLMILVLGLGIMAVAPSAHAVVVVNGSFELDSWISYQYDLESSGVTGWLASDPGNASPLYPWGIDDSAYGITPFGDQFVVLGGFGVDMGTSIQQTVSGLLVGNAYTLNFGLSSEGYTDGFGAGNSNVRVSMLAGSPTASADYAAPSSLHTYWDTWGMFSYSFTAGATSATFAFEDLAMTGNGYDIGIDNVSIEDGMPSVPEPSSILLLSTSVGAWGLAAYRRRRK